MSDRFAPLLDATILPWMALLALAIVVVHAAATVLRSRGIATSWAPVLLRVLAVLGLVLPGWAIFGWYRGLARAREITRSLPIETSTISERFVVNCAALLSLGFLLMIGGIYLARRHGRPTGTR